MRINSKLGTIRSIAEGAMFFALGALAVTAFFQLSKSNPIADIPQPDRVYVTQPLRGCIDRTPGRSVIYSLESEDLAKAFLVPRICQGVIELRDLKSGDTMGFVEFINGYALIEAGEIRVGIK